MPSSKRTAATIVATVSLLAGGTAVAHASTSTPKAPPTSTPGDTHPGQDGHHGRGPRGTAVTGTQLTKVANAVKAKEGAVTVKRVFKDPKGEYHVQATKSGKPAFYEVSSDLKTITQHTFDDHGPGGQHLRGTAVTGTQLTKVTNAVKAKEGAVTVKRVFKDPKGEYHVQATKSGKPAFYEVSSDLKTITQHSIDGRGPGGPDHGPKSGGTPSSSAQQS